MHPYVCVRMEQPNERTDPRLVEDPAPPKPQTPVGEPNTPEIPGTDKQGWFDDKGNRERSGRDWSRGEDANPQPPGFPNSNDPRERVPGPAKPGLDPNPSQPTPEPNYEPGGEDMPPEGPQPPQRYPNPSEPQEPFDRPPVKPQGESGTNPNAQPRD